MSLVINLNEQMEFLLSNEDHSISNEFLIKTIDLTLLDEQASEQSLSQIINLSQTNPIAAVCVFPQHLHLFKHNSDYQLATVVNFPQGIQDSSICIEGIYKAHELGATEIDYVFPYQLYLSGVQETVLNQCAEVIKVCKQLNLVTKVIIETGAFSDMQSLYTLSLKLIALECDFLKTSTGKIAQGASLASVFTLLSAIKDAEQSCGIKVSGGVNTPEQAKNYALLAEIMLHKPISKEWFRIGTSSLLEALQGEVPVANNRATSFN